MLHKSRIVQDVFQPVLGLISYAGVTRRWGLLSYVHGMWPYGTGYIQYVIKPLVEWQTRAVCGFSPCKHISHTYHYHFTIVVGRVIPHIAAPLEHCVFCEFLRRRCSSRDDSHQLTPVLCSTYFFVYCKQKKTCCKQSKTGGVEGRGRG